MLTIYEISGEEGVLRSKQNIESNIEEVVYEEIKDMYGEQSVRFTHPSFTVHVPA